MTKKLEKLKRNLEFFDKEYEKSIKMGDFESEYKLRKVIIQLQKEIQKIKNDEKKRERVNISFDKNGFIVDGEKTKEKIETAIYNLEKKYNKSEISEEEIDEISNSIILLKQDLKRVNNCINYKNKYDEKMKENDKIENRVSELTKKIERMGYSQDSVRPNIGILNEVLYELNELFQKTMYLDENLNRKLFNAIIQVESYKNNLYKNILPKKTKSSSKLITNFKVVFDASTGVYKFEYLRYNNGKYNKETALFVVDKTALSNVERDENLLINLEEFDTKFNTAFKEEMLNNTLKFEVIYDLRKFTKNLSFEERMKVRKIAMNQKKNINAKIVKSPIAKVASVVAVVATASALIFLPQNNKKIDDPTNLQISGEDELNLPKTLTMQNNKSYR